MPILKIENFMRNFVKRSNFVIFLTIFFKVKKCHKY